MTSLQTGHVLTCSSLPDALFLVVGVLGSEVGHRTPNLSVFADANSELHWAENRSFVLVQDLHGDGSRGGGYRSGERRLVGRHHQQGKDGTAFEVQRL